MSASIYRNLRQWGYLSSHCQRSRIHDIRRMITSTSISSYTQPIAINNTSLSSIPVLLPDSLSKLRKQAPFKNSIATVCLPGSIYEKIDSISQAGFDGIEIMDLDLKEASPEEVSELCESKGLKITILQPFRDFEGHTDPIEFSQKIHDFKEAIKVMKTLKTDLILFCSNCLADCPDDRDLFVEQLKIAAEIAAQNDIRIAYEALSWATHINTLEDLWDIVKRVDHANFGLCIDSFHIISRNCDINLIQEIGSKVFFVQLCDAPLLNITDLIYYARNYRNFPFQGDYQLLEQLNLINSVNYQGYLSLEVFNSSFKSSNLPNIIAEDGLRSLLYLQRKFLELENKTEKVFSSDIRVLGIKSGVEGTTQPQANGFIYTDNLKNMEVVVDNVLDFNKRLEYLGYTGLFKVSGENSSPTSQVRRIVSVTSSTLEFNREILLIKSIFNFQFLENDELNSFNDFGLPQVLSFGDITHEDGLIITIAKDRLKL